MSVVHLNESSSGATRLSGTNGDLNAFLKWALVTNGGWANTFTATNADVFRAPSGNRFPLFCQHDSAVSGAATLAVMRGCESASAAAIASLTNPFPTVAQIAAASANWGVSSTANTTARNFDIYIAPTWFWLFINFNGTASTGWTGYFYGDCSPTIAADTWATMIVSRNTTSAPSGSDILSGCTTASALNGSNLMYFCRSADGTVNSTHAAYVVNGQTAFGWAQNAATMQNSPTGLIERDKACVMCTGATTSTYSTTKGMVKRAWVPNIWNSLHSGPGSVATRDTFTDTSYSGSATFRVFNTSSVQGQWIIEETDTWSAPSG